LGQAPGPGLGRETAWDVAFGSLGAWPHGPSRDGLSGRAVVGGGIAAATLSGSIA